MNKPNVAFICVHNSCRSQMAEALGKKLAANVFESFSAGTETKPRINPDAKLISRVDDIDAIYASAGGAGTDRGTGGMIAKLQAAKIVTESGIPMFILNGHDPEILYTLLDGGHVGTYFSAKRI